MIEIFINNTPYVTSESVTVSRSLDDASGSFSISTSTTESSEFPIRTGDFIIITVDGEDKIYGNVDEVSSSGDATTQTVTTSGRDNIADLIDSSVPDSVKVIEGPISLSGLCEKVIDALGLTGITVIDNTGQTNIFSADELQAAESGDRALAFLQSYARKKQVFLIPSGAGDLILFRPGSVSAPAPLLHQKNNNANNIKSWSVVKSQSDRYRTYLCRSQDNIGFDDKADYGTKGMARTGIAKDSEIRSTRILEIVAEESMTDDECTERANEEANIRRARSTEYNCVVAGHSPPGGAAWDIGQQANVIDEFADISGDFIIRSVSYTLSLGSGSTTSIVCAPIDAYSVQAEPTPTDIRKSSEGTKFSRINPDSVQRFKRDK